ncbi:phasin family protein [Bradyrhizobium neotropicale]|uniref:phasin family protein n=1 Tax=Bradyrhizobium neotropicale TaxID=1497615 RepID=UPI001AD6510E|nr:hypothetical protein [Bradyrhizobium neotropicale]MBO4228490.1 hypothetical protein [Bradyrhizobium neotropicale]
MPATTAENEKRERQTRELPELSQASASGAGGAADGVGKSTAAASRVSIALAEWQKLIEGTRSLLAELLKDGLALTASSLQDQANFLKNLAEAKNLSELLKCHLNFAEQSWSRSFSEGSKMLDHLKTQQSSAARSAIRQA